MQPSVIKSVDDEWQTWPEYRICSKEEVVNRKGKLHRSRELQQKVVNYLSATVFIGSIRG